jgi:ferredoxin-NADP reductase/Na+-translocating ferredoxin:NAD+ oxidoreductase RnfD subunit
MKQLALSGRAFLHFLDWINDRVTSYRLVLYTLLTLLGWALIGTGFGKIPYSAAKIAASAALVIGICWLSNRLISRFLDIPSNNESGLITGLILALILAPAGNGTGYAVLAAASIAAIASKYVITFQKAHVFNPAATGAFIAGAVFHQYPAWWVGTKFVTPLVVIGGLLILRKMNRFTMAGIFLATFLIYLIYGTSAGGNLHFLWLELVSTQVLFFTFIMLTEPLTSPVKLNLGIIYALVVGILYTATKLRFSPEEALLAGNLLTFVIARNRRYEVKFVRRIKEAEGIYSYIFTRPPGFKFRAGQYMEWTLSHNRSDSRGNRRYLTIASSPTEQGLMFTIKQPPKASAFKQMLSELKPGEKILASRLSGDFALPRDPNQKVALLAGGVGITPFRSMIKYTLDSKQPRDISLIYSAGSPNEFAYRQLIDQAADLGVKVSLATGRLDAARIKKALPDFKDRRFYISGPYGFVGAMQTELINAGAAPTQIVTDYFPGYGA